MKYHYNDMSFDYITLDKSKVRDAKKCQKLSYPPNFPHIIFNQVFKIVQLFHLLSTGYFQSHTHTEPPPKSKSHHQRGKLALKSHRI